MTSGSIESQSEEGSQNRKETCGKQPNCGSSTRTSADLPLRVIAYMAHAMLAQAKGRGLAGVKAEWSGPPQGPTHRH